jgi:hypothetical protein
MQHKAHRFVLGRDDNVVRVDFSRDPDPPAPRFPGAGALRDFGCDIAGAAESIAAGAWCAPVAKSWKHAKP